MTNLTATDIHPLLDEFAIDRDEESWPEDLEFEFGHLRLQFDEGRPA